MRLLTIITLEILITNLFITFTCLKRKYSMKTNLIVLFIFTSALFIIYNLFLSDIDGQSYVQIILGSLYVIPLLFLFEASLKRIIIIMTFAWSYTLTINSYSVIVANSLNLLNYEVTLVIIQTLLLALSLRFILHITQSKIHIIAKNVSSKHEHYLILMGVSIFAGLIVLRYFALELHSLKQFLLVSYFGAIGLIVYIIMYDIVTSRLRLTEINDIAYNDTLTGIPNRFSFFEALDHKTKHPQPFLLLYMDLDGLKQVNDQYGHDIGDEYLTYFTKAVDQYIDTDGILYRIAGDEFICIISKSLAKYDITTFQQAITNNFEYKYEFKGVSIGYSYYPKEGISPETLINKADNRMYKQKNKK